MSVTLFSPLSEAPSSLASSRRFIHRVRVFFSTSTLTWTGQTIYIKSLYINEKYSMVGYFRLWLICYSFLLSYWYLIILLKSLPFPTNLLKCIYCSFSCIDHWQSQQRHPGDKTCVLFCWVLLLWETAATRYITWMKMCNYGSCLKAQKTLLCARKLP